jgi:hypothetical protein
MSTGTSATGQFLFKEMEILSLYQGDNYSDAGGTAA